MEKETNEKDPSEEAASETPPSVSIPESSKEKTESTDATPKSVGAKPEVTPPPVVFATPTCTKQWQKIRMRKMIAQKKLVNNRRRIPTYPVPPWRMSYSRPLFPASHWRLQIPTVPCCTPCSLPWWGFQLPNISVCPKHMKYAIMQGLPLPPPYVLVEDELTLDPEHLFKTILASDIEECVKSSIKPKPKCNSRNKFEKYENIQLNCMDPLILYGITLHRYSNNMCEMIRVAELAIESNLIPPADAAPPIPKKFQIILKHTRNSLNYMPKKITPFSMGNGNDDIPDLSYSVIIEILYQSVAAIVGLLGFETTQQSVLDVFVDVLVEFLKKISYHFKIAYEDQQRGWMQDFPNIAERVLVELGMGGARALHDYYQCRVTGYVKLLEKHCEDLYMHYNSLIPSSTSGPVEEQIINDTVIKVEKEEEDIEIDTSQVQIALNEEVELPSLDAGFQLLSSLEAGT